MRVYSFRRIFIFYPKISAHCSLFFEEVLVCLVSSNNTVEDRKKKLYCRTKRVLQTSFRSGSFFIPKKLSPRCVGKEPTDHFFNKSCKSAKISCLLFQQYDRRTSEMVSELEKRIEMKMGLSSINHIVCTLSISCRRQGTRSGTYTLADYLKIGSGQSVRTSPAARG